MTTFTNLTSGGVTSSTSATTASITPTANRLILITVHAYISTGSTQPATPTVTGNGITYSLVQSQDIDTAGTDRATMFMFRGMSSSPSSGAVSISFGATTQTRVVWAVDQSDANINISGTNGSGAIVQSTGVTLGAAATSASVSYASLMGASSSGYSAWCHQVQEATTPRSGWTEVADAAPVSLATIETQYVAGTDTAGSASWATSARGGGIILEIAPTPILLAAYSFDEASGNVLDVTGKGNDFSISGNTIRTASGHTNNGLTQTAAATAAGPAATNIQAKTRTWMTWIKFSAAVNGWMLEFHVNSANTGAWGLLDISGSLRFRAKDSSNTIFESSTINRNLGNWQHITATYDGANLKCYINASLLSTTPMTTGIWTADLLNVLDQTGSDVILDDVRFYDGVVDDASISTLMSTPVTGGSGVTGTIAVTQGAQTGSATGQLGYSGTIAATQGPQTGSASGTVANPVTGSIAVTQGAQTGSATGQLGYSGGISVTQGAQAGAAVGQLGYSGSIARTQGPQTGSATGQLGYSGTIAATQGAQAGALSGTVSNPGSYTGTIAVTQGPQTGSLSGTVVNPVTGTISLIQANQTGTATGRLGYAGTVALVESPDLLVAAGSVSGPITGAIALVQGPQIGHLTGSFAPLVTFGTSGPGDGKAAKASGATGDAPKASAASMTVPSATGG